MLNELELRLEIGCGDGTAADKEKGEFYTFLSKRYIFADRDPTNEYVSYVGDAEVLQVTRDSIDICILSVSVQNVRIDS